MVRRCARCSLVHTDLEVLPSHPHAGATALGGSLQLEGAQQDLVRGHKLPAPAATSTSRCCCGPVLLPAPSRRGRVAAAAARPPCCIYRALLPTCAPHHHPP